MRKMRTPLRSRKNENGKYKAKFADKQLGEVKLKDGKISIKGFKNYDIVTQSNSPAYAVLLLKEIPEAYRMIIMAEILRRNITL